GGSATTRMCRPSCGRRWSRPDCRSTASSRRPTGGPGTSGSERRLPGCRAGCANSRPVTPDTMEPRHMRPITFSCSETLDVAPEEIARQILDLDRWPEFQGYGVLPGIRAAQFEARKPEVVGTRIRVTDTDGSSHVEQIVEWEPDRRLRLHMGEFPP